MSALADHRVLVLAAGRGRRMGEPKALMPVDGAPWWRRQERSMRAAGARSLWVVSPDVEAAMADSDAAPTERVCASPDAPMFESIVTGLRALAPSPPAGVFILPVDVPAPSAPTLARLTTGPSVAVPRSNGRTGHPIWLDWGWVREHLLTTTPAARRLDLLIKADATPVDVDDDAVAWNLNTPADLAAWQARSVEE